MIVDPGLFGNLDIRMYRKVGNKREDFSFSCFDIISNGIYEFRDNAKIYPFYYNDATQCKFVNGQINYAKGFIKFSRYDLQNGTISGEFECKLYDAATSCNTIKITNGRFDYKL